MNTSGMSVRLSRAEQRERTHSELLAAAERLFVEQGFHATSVDQVAAAAGFTKGAVYSNFSSKEDLFLEVFDARAEKGAAMAANALAEHGDEEGLRRLVSDSLRRRGREDGWLAAFFEFWAHAVRNPGLRERFAEIHTRALEPMAAASRRLAEERGVNGAVAPEEFNLAMNSMQLGLILERLTDPAAVKPDLAERMVGLSVAGWERS
jgi:AcrR family transcriptional regulator